MQKRCPSCGSSYNGKKCRNCYYVPFDNTVTTAYEHMHVPASPPQQPRTFPRQPQPRQVFQTRTVTQTRRVNGRPVRRKWTSRSRDGEKKPVTIRLIAILLALLLGPGLLSMITGALFGAVESIVSDVEEVWAEAEPIPLPENGLVLYDDNAIRLIAGWQQGMELDHNIPIFLVNDTAMEVIASNTFAIVNGCMVDDVFFYCDAQPSRTAQGTLWLDLEALTRLGIDRIHNLTFDIEILNGEDYTTISTNQITLNAPGGEGKKTPLEDRGLELFSQDGVRLVYQGAEANEFNELSLLFYAENTGSVPAQLCSEDLPVNGVSCGHSLWQELLPDTCTFFSVAIYNWEDAALSGPEAVETVTITPYAVFNNDWENPAMGSAQELAIAFS